MSDLIDRQAAIDALDVLCQEHRYKIPGKVETYSQYNEAWQDALDRAEGAIGNLPSAQSEPKKGKWELKEDILSWEGTFDGYFCSECGKGFLNDLCCNNGADWVDVQKDFKFCPFCGADMRGETNG